MDRPAHSPWRELAPQILSPEEEAHTSLNHEKRHRGPLLILQHLRRSAPRNVLASSLHEQLLGGVVTKRR
jgi:hypothetical protein